MSELEPSQNETREVIFEEIDIEEYVLAKKPIPHAKRYVSGWLWRNLEHFRSGTLPPTRRIEPFEPGSVPDGTSGSRGIASHPP
jgi:hypothetical protein